MYIIKTIIKIAEKLEKEVLFDYVEELIPERRGEIMTIAEQLKQEGKMEGIREGMEKGIEKGREETLKQTAINALKKGLDIETIAELTGLSVERIEELKKGLN